MENLRSLTEQFTNEVVKRMERNVVAIWLSGSLARGDFIVGVSDVDSELIVAEKEDRIRITDDISELKDLTESFREKALNMGASEFHCFVFRVNDFKEDLYTLDIAVNAKTLYGKAPEEVFNVEKLQRKSKQFAINVIRRSASYAREALEGKSQYGIEQSVKLVMDADHPATPLWEAQVVVKAANFVIGKGEWTKSRSFITFAKNFPEYESFAVELWEYKLDQSKLGLKGREYVEGFLMKCLRFLIDIEQKYTSCVQ